jgi:hypothetical protein
VYMHRQLISHANAGTTVPKFNYFSCDDEKGHVVYLHRH